MAAPHSSPLSVDVLLSIPLSKDWASTVEVARMQAFTPSLAVLPNGPHERNATLFTCVRKPQISSVRRSRHRHHVQAPRAAAVDPPSVTESIHQDLLEGELLSAILRVEDAVSRQTDGYAPVVTYHYLHDLLYQASRSRQWEVALRTFYAIERTGLYCVRSTSWHLFSALCHAGRVTEAEQAMAVLWKPFIILFDGSQKELEERQFERRRPDEKMVARMANSAIEVGRPDVAVNAVQELDNHEVPFTVFTISVLIKAHGRQGNAKGVTKVLAELGDRGIEPDLVIFNTAIDAYVRSGEKVMAGQVLREINRRGLTPNATSYNPILREVARSGRLEDALALRRDMERRHIKPTSYTYNALIQTCVTAKRWALAMEFLRQSFAAAGEHAKRYSEKSGRGLGAEYENKSPAGAMSKDVAVGFTTVISGLALDGDIKRAVKLLEHMVKRIEDSGKTIKLEIEIGISVAAVLSALLRQDDVVRAWMLFRSIRKHFNIRLPPDTYNAVIRGLARRGDVASVEAAEQVFSEMMQVFQKKRTSQHHRGLPSAHAAPSNGAREATCEDVSLAYNAMIDGHAQSGSTTAGERLLNEMEENGHVATVVTYTTLISGYGKEMDVVSTRRVFKRMRERGISPDRVTMNAFIGGCVRAGDMDLALRLFEEMQRIGGRVSPNLVTFSAIIAGYVRQNKANEAWDTYEEMKGLGIVPNERLLDRMMAAFVSPDLRPRRGEVDEASDSDEDVESVASVAQGAESDESESMELLGGIAEKQILGRTGWRSERAMVLLEDMKVCKCSEVNKKRWRKAINSVWSL